MEVPMITGPIWPASHGDAPRSHPSPTPQTSPAITTSQGKAAFFQRQCSARRKDLELEQGTIVSGSPSRRVIVERARIRPAWCKMCGVADLVVELVDGSSVVLASDALSPRARDELDVWGLVPAEGDGGSQDTGRADPATWQQALEAGPLLVAALQGVIGNAAWATFPAAARYLRALWSTREREVRDAVAAGAVARRALQAVAPQLAATVMSSSRDGEGVWHVQLEVAPRRRATVRIVAGGAVTHVQIDAEPIHVAAPAPSQA